MKTTIIGIDCATNPVNVGLALANFNGECTTIQRVRSGSRLHSPADIVTQWVQESSLPVLLALDAPLGWPAPLAEALSLHQAGAGLKAEAHDLFRRATDRFIKQQLGKQPLDVGADRIARTAHAALRLLDALRAHLQEPIPLAWQADIQGVMAIEVYPAATLTAHGISTLGYKQVPALGVKDRERIVMELGMRMQLPAEPITVARNSDAVDAVVCVLAAQDFLLGQAMPPPDRTLAEREGWIWVRQRSSQ